MPSTIVLPAILSDHLVVQADRPATIWGTAAPRERIRIELAGRRVDSVADRAGAFRARLPPGDPGGPYRLRIAGHSERVVEDVLIGDVWLGSGQSNMEWWVAHCRDAEREIPAALHPRLRLFGVPAASDRLPREEVDGRWVACDPRTVRDFAAVLYFFGREIHLRTGRPIGLIASAWGGTRIEPWISLDALRRCPAAAPALRAHRRVFAAPERVGDRGFHRDTGDRGLGLGWANRVCARGGWKAMPVPGCWNRHGLDRVGAVWFRREVAVPRAWRGRDLRLELGPLVDFDDTYVNGERVGGLPPGTPGAWNIPRSYVVPAALVRPGANAIAVRVFAHGVNGGFAGTAAQLRLSPINDPAAKPVPLAGRWRHRVERGLPPIGAASRGIVPGTIHHAMIAPLHRFALRGVLWYQGESNVGDAAAYQELLTLLIRDWRERWGDARLPFYVAQLSDYARGVADDGLARLREAQLLATRLPHTGLAVTLDGGERDIHARDKQLVGHRLALIALAQSYGKRVAHRGPRLREAVVEGARIRLRFEDPAAGLATSDGRPPRDFAIAGADRAFVPARAAIAGSDIVVWSPRVREPVAVRYAWADTPRCTLVDRHGLPASPFRTDRW